MPRKIENRFKIYVSPKALQESVKGEVIQNLIKFPRELCEEHPFEFSTCEEAAKKIGILNSAIEKTVDFILASGFYVTSKNKKAEVLITDLLKDIGADQLLRTWIREALTKGSGFLEIAMDKSSTPTVKLLNANHMYIVRNKKGELQGYNQYVGGFDKFNINKIINFSTSQIAHLPISIIGDCPYGFGMAYPALRILENFTQADKDMHMLSKRKANSPYHVKVGTPEDPPKSGEVEEVGEKFEWLNNMHEWITDYRVDIKTIDFGNLSDKFTSLLEHDVNMLFYVFQIPPVIMGLSNIPEGLAMVQIDAFERRILSLQSNVEKVVEEQLFKPYLKLNGIEAHVEMEWGMPSENKVNERLLKMTELIKIPFISENMRRVLEKDIVTSLGYEEEAKKLFPEPEKDLEKEREDEENIKQPEIPGEKPGARENIIYEAWNWKDTDTWEDIPFEEMTVKQFVNLKELSGFNFKDFLKSILKNVKKDKFEDLKANTKEDLTDGLLNEQDIEKLRNVLEEGFKKNKSIKQIEKDLKDTIDFKDRIAEGKLVLAKESRPNNISRTETVRLANQGLLDLYKENKIEEVRFLAALSDRTCPKCESLNGRIFKINESYGVIPIHPNCRCSWISII